MTGVSKTTYDAIRRRQHGGNGGAHAHGNSNGGYHHAHSNGGGMGMGSGMGSHGHDGLEDEEEEEEEMSRLQELCRQLESKCFQEQAIANEKQELLEVRWGNQGS